MSVSIILKFQWKAFTCRTIINFCSPNLFFTHFVFVCAWRIFLNILSMENSHAASQSVAQWNAKFNFFYWFNWDLLEFEVVSSFFRVFLAFEWFFEWQIIVRILVMGSRKVDWGRVLCLFIENHCYDINGSFQNKKIHINIFSVIWQTILLYDKNPERLIEFEYAIQSKYEFLIKIQVIISC